MHITPLEIVLGVVILIIIFLLLREWFTWYWKYTAMLTELKAIHKTLDRIEEHLEQNLHHAVQDAPRLQTAELDKK